MARLRLDRAAAAFPEIHQLGYFATLAEELEARKRRTTTGQVPTRFGSWIQPRLNRIVTARLRKRISAIMGYADDSAIGAEQPLTEVGMDSLMAVRIRNTVRGDFGAEPAVALLLQGATIADLTADLIRQLGLEGSGQQRTRRRSSRSSPATCRSAPASRHAAEGRTTRVTTSIESQSASSVPHNAIAVVGMAGRFPGAGSVSAFWDNLRRGQGIDRHVVRRRLAHRGHQREGARRITAYVRRAALMDGIDEFDAEFFGFTPQAARMTDPQHRLFLQSAWHAIEDAGYDPAQLDGSVGVFGTSSASGYLLHNLMSHHDPRVIIGQGATFEMVNLSLHNDKDHLATRVAHQFNLRGPALSVQTACSSALVAVHLACQSILNGECDMALAGGASIRIPHRVGYWHEPGSMVSATGHCRPFDVRSDGTIFGSGVGVVVLKPLQAAIGDGDRIHAVIRGSAINNDGSTKMTYAAPNAAGQADVIAEAHAVAEIDASTVSYVETHGTGTPLGDPIEIEGLRQAFAVSAARPGPVRASSVRSSPTSVTWRQRPGWPA